MTFSLVYAFSEHYVLPISHDEVVHGKGSLIAKMPGDRWQQLAGLRAYLAYMWAHPGKQLLFMGSEFGQYAEWSESRGLDWWLLDNADHRGVQQCLADLNRVYKETPALWSQDNYLGRLRVDRRRRLRGQHVLVAALGHRRLGARLRRQPVRRPARGVPHRPAARRRLGRGAQHRRRAVRRLRRRQPRRGRGRGGSVARASVLGPRPRAPARRPLAPPRHLTGKSNDCGPRRDAGGRSRSCGSD